MIDQSLPRAVERLDVLLFEGLLRHEPHVPVLYRGADRLGVITVVLLPAHEWLHVLRGHDLNGVTELLELPLPIECGGGAAASGHWERERRWVLPRAINQRWSLDFVCDTLSDGRRFRILCVVDDFSREGLATVVDTALGGVRVVRELDQLTLERGTPKVIVSDNGTELTSVAVLRWAIDRVAWHYIPASRSRMLSSSPLTAGCAMNNGMDPASLSNGLEERAKMVTSTIKEE
jgi:transposase InsO family protein